MWLINYHIWIPNKVHSEHFFILSVDNDSENCTSKWKVCYLRWKYLIYAPLMMIRGMKYWRRQRLFLYHWVCIYIFIWYQSLHCPWKKSYCCNHHQLWLLPKHHGQFVKNKMFMIRASLVIISRRTNLKKCSVDWLG